MIVEFFKRGTGGSTGPIDYFLGKDRNREHAKILSGTKFMINLSSINHIT